MRRAFLLLRPVAKKAYNWIAYRVTPNQLISNASVNNVNPIE